MRGASVAPVYVPPSPTQVFDGLLRTDVDAALQGTDVVVTCYGAKGAGKVRHPSKEIAPPVAAPLHDDACAVVCRAEAFLVFFFAFVVL